MDTHWKETPQWDAAHHMLFVVRQEVARQLISMQEAEIIESSSSCWSSPVVMVQKKDILHTLQEDHQEGYFPTAKGGRFIGLDWTFKVLHNIAVTGRLELHWVHRRRLRLSRHMSCFSLE